MNYRDALSAERRRTASAQSRTLRQLTLTDPSQESSAPRRIGPARRTAPPQTPPTARELERFVRHIDREAGECWLWRGARQSRGYGSVGLRGRTENAHRAAWWMATGEWPPAELQVCHRCDVRLCVRPAHLFLGTATDNMRDAKEKGRLCTGAGNGRAKLTLATVRALRAAPAPLAVLEEIANRHGVSVRHLTDVAAGEYWPAERSA